MRSRFRSNAPDPLPHDDIGRAMRRLRRTTQRRDGTSKPLAVSDRSMSSIVQSPQARPLSVVSTLFLSITPAAGLALRSSGSRAPATGKPSIVESSALLRRSWKEPRTVEAGGNRSAASATGIYSTQCRRSRSSPSEGRSSAVAGRPRSAETSGRGHDRRDQRPFPILQVTWIASHGRRCPSRAVSSKSLSISHRFDDKGK